MGAGPGAGSRPRPSIGGAAPHRARLGWGRPSRWRGPPGHAQRRARAQTAARRLPARRRQDPPCLEPPATGQRPLVGARPPRLPAPCPARQHHRSASGGPIGAGHRPLPPNRTASAAAAPQAVLSRGSCPLAKGRRRCRRRVDGRPEAASRPQASPAAAPWCCRLRAPAAATPAANRHSNCAAAGTLAPPGTPVPRGGLAGGRWHPPAPPGTCRPPHGALAHRAGEEGGGRRALACCRGGSSLLPLTLLPPVPVARLLFA